jgi:uncharacterized membrane protein
MSKAATFTIYQHGINLLSSLKVINLVANFIHVDLKQTLLLAHMLKINKNRKCYTYKLA